MTIQKGLIVVICVLALAIIFNGLCQRYEPTNAGRNGLCARFDRLTGEHQQRDADGKWLDVAAIADGIPVR